MKGLMNCMACFSTKGLSTQITFIWLLSSVNYPMIWKVCILFKAVATNITFIWSLSSMNSAMNLKRYISFKAAAAHITFIWFLTSVNYPMILKVCILFKAVATNITFMWSLSSMNSVMNLKRCISFKAAATHITFICFLSSVNYPMILKVYILFKAVATYITFIWFLSCIISPMNCMGCIIIKGLATYVTFIWFPSFYMDSFLSREFWVLKKGSVTLIRVFLVCFLVWCLFWGMCDSTLMFMRNASVDNMSSLRWQTWGATVDTRHNLTIFKYCSSDWTICNSSWKLDSCLSTGLFPVSFILWWFLPSVRFLLWDIDIPLSFLSLSVHRLSKSCIASCIFLRKTYLISWLLALPNISFWIISPFYCFLLLVIS